MLCTVNTTYQGGKSIDEVINDIVDATGCKPREYIVGAENLFFGYPAFDRKYERCYIILDGYTPQDLRIEDYCGKIFVPSHAVYKRYHWKKPVTIVPHGVRYIFPPKNDWNIEFLYVSGPAPRKYPPGSDYVIKHLQGKLQLMSQSINPYKADNSVMYYILSNPTTSTNAYTLTRYDLYRLYRSAKFYLSLSGGGAFELTPLEAMASGTPPITLNVEPFIEYNKCGLTVPATGILRTPGTDIYLYDPEEMLEIAKYAEGIGKEEYYDMSARCVEIAKIYYYKIVYPKLYA